MAVELRRGRVSALRVVGEKTKSGLNCKAIFKLDGKPAEYMYGSTGYDDGLLEAPFQNGDRVITSGKMRRKAVFVIYAMRCPNDPQIYCTGDVELSIMFGCLILALPCALSAPLFLGHLRTKDIFFVLLSMLPMTILSAIMISGGLKTAKAKRMVALAE